MDKHWLRSVALVGMTASALLVGTVGIASAKAPAATTTHTSCVTRTGPWAAKACVRVTATSVGSGQWKVTGVRASLEQISFNPRGKDYYFDMHAYNSRLNDVALIDSYAVAHSSGKSVSYTYNLSDDTPQPDFWTNYTGFIDIDVTVDHGGYNRLDFGSLRQDLK